MKIHVRKNAMVCFDLVGGGENGICGRVKDLNDEEIIIIKQKLVSEESFIQSEGTTKLKLMSVDVYPEVHLNKNCIRMWWYYHIPAESENICIKDVFQPEDIKNIDIKFINYYNDRGYYEGIGDFLE